MAKKASTVFVCSSCGYESSKWLGKCPSCNEWNSFYEEKAVNVQAKNGTGALSKPKQEAVKLNEVKYKSTTRIKTGVDELDRVLGGGFVEGSLTLLGGEPGIGKSTLILQICDKVKVDGKILYVSGEESAEQIKLRADRLGINNDNILFLSETDIDAVENAIEKYEPKFVIIDSIQTMYSDELTSAPGSISQVREMTARVMKMCKGSNITTIIIGHVTKDGSIAGPRVLEHMVDVVLYLEGERFFSYRILRGVKNRFGSTNEIGMFEMEDKGMVEITNPSSILISDHEENPAGSIVTVSIEGTRPLLLEMQALCVQSVFGMPRRNSIGIDYNRLTLLMAVMEKRCNMNLGSQDVYLNIVGGMKVTEPAIDLGIILATASSFSNISIPQDVVAIGEVGLTGEVRRVNLIDKRIKEAEKLGYKTIIIPQSNKKLLKDNYKLDIIGVQNINDALKFLKLKG
jgi:DNA repair protein RadA/Sms